MTQEEIETKGKELNDLVTKVDLWVNTPMSKKKQDEVKAILNELAAALDVIDEQYLETKLVYYRKVYERIKDN